MAVSLFSMTIPTRLEMGHENSINRYIRKGRTDAKTKNFVLKLKKNVQMRGLTPSRLFEGQETYYTLFLIMRTLGRFQLVVHQIQ